MTRIFDVFFDLRLNKRLGKQSRRRWFGYNCAHCDVTVVLCLSMLCHRHYRVVQTVSSIVLLRVIFSSESISIPWVRNIFLQVSFLPCDLYLKPLYPSSFWHIQNYGLSPTNCRMEMMRCKACSWGNAWKSREKTKLLKKEVYERTSTKPWSTTIKARRLLFSKHILRLNPESPAREALDECHIPVEADELAEYDSKRSEEHRHRRVLSLKT